MAINLKQEFDNLLANDGHNIYLQRSTDANDFENVLEIHTVRHMYPATRGLPRVREEEVEGIVHTADMIYFFRAEAAPKEGDRIYDGDPSLDETRIYIVDHSVPMRGKGGILIFYTVGVTRERPN